MDKNVEMWITLCWNYENYKLNVDNVHILWKSCFLMWVKLDILKFSVHFYVPDIEKNLARQAVKRYNLGNVNMTAFF